MDVETVNLCELREQQKAERDRQIEQWHRRNYTEILGNDNLEQILREFGSATAFSSASENHPLRLEYDKRWEQKRQEHYANLSPYEAALDRQKGHQGRQNVLKKLRELAERDRRGEMNIVTFRGHDSAPASSACTS